MAKTFKNIRDNSGGGGGAVDSVNGQTGVVVLTKSSIGLGNVNNTSDANKPVSTATQTALDLKANIANPVFTGQVYIPDGTVSDPGLVFTTDGDQDTGLYHTGDGVVAVATNGVNSATFTTAGLAVTGDISANNYPPSGAANRLVRFDNLGDLNDISQLQVDDNGYTIGTFVPEPNGISGSFDIIRNNVSVEPLQASPNETWQLFQNQVSIDPNSSGFDFGTTGQAFRFEINNVIHNGTSDIGVIEFIQNNFSLGNGTDPIDVNGFAYLYGFGAVNANVNISGPMQGYGYQPNINSSATIGSTEYTQAFYDNANIQCASPGYTSFNAGPNIASINSTNNYVGLNIQPTIPVFSANAGMTGIAVGGTLGTFGTNAYYNGVNVNPTITSARYAAGLNVSMDNVTVYAGVSSSLVIQDLTIAADLPGTTGDGVTIEYTPGGTAGSEVVSQLGLAFTVQIDSGVSTATQVAAALNAFPGFTINLNVTISGVGSNPQVTQAATNLAGGVDPGRKQAAYLDGDVEITGGLTFGGALSIDQLNAFDNQALADNGGTPASIHSLITQPTVADNITVANADLLGVNTAMLLTIGDNAVVTTALTGIAALGLPAVVTMGSGSTVDQISGALFAVSLDGGAGGGTIDRLDLCRSLGIPNGITAINNLRGFKFDLPFGDPGTTTWGFYEEPGVNNYLAGNLLIGGTAGSDDTVTNTSVGLEVKSTTKAFMNARMTSTQRDALTAVNGMQIYNSTTDKLQVYAAGVWTDLH